MYLIILFANNVRWYNSRLEDEINKWKRDAVKSGTRAKYFVCDFLKKEERANKRKRRGTENRRHFVNLTEWRLSWQSRQFRFRYEQRDENGNVFSSHSAQNVIFESGFLDLGGFSTGHSDRRCFSFRRNSPSLLGCRGHTSVKAGGPVIRVRRAGRVRRVGRVGRVRRVTRVRHVKKSQVSVTHVSTAKWRGLPVRRNKNKDNCQNVSCINSLCY